MKINKELASYIILAGIILGLGFNFLFLRRVPGLSLPLYFLLVVGMIQLGKYLRDGNWQFKRVELLYLPIFLVSLTPLLAQNYTLSTWSVLLTMLGGTYVTIMTLWDVRLKNFGFLSMLFLTFFHQLIQIGYFFKPFIDLLRRGKGKSQKNAQLRKVLVRVMLGVVLALPIMLCFFVLFASADTAFSQIFSLDFLSLDNLLSSERLAELVVFLFVTVLWIGYLAAGYYYNLKMGNTGSQNESGGVRRVIDPIVASVASVMINLLFVCFVVIQFVYLFGGQERVLSLGITYSQYARQGFFELVVAAAISMMVVYAFRRFGSFRSAANNLVLQFSLILQIAFTLVILFSAYYRMQLYQSAYGMTDTRLFVFAFLLFLAVAFVVLGVAVVWKPALTYFSLVIFNLGAVAIFALALANPDAQVARFNISAYEDGSLLVDDLDTSYLNRLSSDAYAQLVDVEEVTDDSYEMCWLAHSWVRETEARSSLQSFNLYRAGNVSKMDEALSEYIQDGEVVDSCGYRYW